MKRLRYEMSGRLQNTSISSVMVRMKVSIHTASPIATRLAVLGLGLGLGLRLANQASRVSTSNGYTHGYGQS